MINLQDFDMPKMVKSLNTVTKQAEALTNAAMSSDLMDLMTDDQKKQMRDARKNLKAVNSKDLAKMSAILEKFKNV
tara:strand:+ start:213 stop:440 length:228 start_codon:yes stop_codon:yes gene_type:complete